ncbi:CsbD family protein [Flaviflexus huanghaiensis]|uniref:CsbD family protein n=1 Tax=Flaviflexus huanghaiensis TaxID=1111473 RepID=UPI0015FCF653|nr:CsbD family protein [Flaviflexus huanghaiensis]
MSADDKAENQFEDLGGKAKEGAGKVTGDEQLEREGKGDQLSAKAKKVGESAKDFAQEAKDKAKDMFNK